MKLPTNQVLFDQLLRIEKSGPGQGELADLSLLNPDRPGCPDLQDLIASATDATLIPLLLERASHRQVMTLIAAWTAYRSHVFFWKDGDERIEVLLRHLETQNPRVTFSLLSLRFADPGCT